MFADGFVFKMSSQELIVPDEFMKPMYVVSYILISLVSMKFKL